jgi:hypothetical protein
LLLAILAWVRCCLYDGEGNGARGYFGSCAVSDCAIVSVCSGCSFGSYQNCVSLARHQCVVFIPLDLVGPNAACRLHEEVP